MTSITYAQSMAIVRRATLDRAFFGPVDHRHSHHIMIMTATVYAMWVEGRRDIIRKSLTASISPSHVSEATAFRLVDKMIGAGWLVDRDGVIEPTDEFLASYTEHLNERRRVVESVGVKVSLIGGDPDFTIWRQLLGGGKIIHVEGVREHLGYEDDELLGKTSAGILHKDYLPRPTIRETWQDIFEAVNAGVLQEAHHVWANIHKDGHAVFCRKVSKRGTFNGERVVVIESTICSEEEFIEATRS